MCQDAVGCCSCRIWLRVFTKIRLILAPVGVPLSVRTDPGTKSALSLHTSDPPRSDVYLAWMREEDAGCKDRSILQSRTILFSTPTVTPGSILLHKPSEDPTVPEGFTHPRR